MLLNCCVIDVRQGGVALTFRVRQKLTINVLQLLKDGGGAATTRFNAVPNERVETAKTRLGLATIRDEFCIGFLPLR